MTITTLTLLCVLPLLASVAAGDDVFRGSNAVALRSAHMRLQQQLFPGPTAPAVYRTEKVYVEMRDRVKLYTVAFIPLNGKKKFDTLMVRTPYGTDGLKGEGEQYVGKGYAVVMQDFRGRYRSEGQFECWFNASSDAADTVDWIIHREWSSGVIFQQGTSAPGIALYMSELALFSPTHVRALFPVVATAELHTTVFQGGAYRYSLMHGWLTGISEAGFESNFTTHEGLTPYWDNVTFTNKWARVTAPGVHLTGWYDIFNQQQLDAYDAYQTKSTFGRNLNYLVILPTGHCAGGEVEWPGALEGFAYAQELAYILFQALGSHPRASEYAARLAGLPFLAWYVLGPGLPNTRGNYWTNASAFPQPTPTSLYLSVEGTLSAVPPSTQQQRSFVYDPRRPVPTRGGNNLVLPQCGPWDQADLDERSDVLSFTSARLTDVLPITGRVTAELYVSTNCTDTDFTAKLEDVFPNGTSLLIQDGIVRMRWRLGGEAPQPVQPGAVYAITVDVWSTSYIFNVGHAVRLSISSSNFPRFSVNPNTGQPLTSAAPPLVALNTVHAGPGQLSRLLLPVVSLKQLPESRLDVAALQAIDAELRD